MMMPKVDFTLHNALTRWDLSAFPLATIAVLVALAVWYLRADWVLATRGRRWSGWRTWSFMAALVTVLVALASPLAAMTGTYFQAHVLQHLLLMVVAPPLAALGAPSTLLLQTSSRRTKERWLHVLRSRPFAALTHPLTAWALYFGTMFIFFLTSLVNTAMHDMALMDAINLVFLFGATVYWWPMVGIDPIVHWKMGHGARMFNILLGSGIEAFLGVALTSESHPVATMYTIASTHAGGDLLWVSTEFVTVGAFLPIYLQWVRSEDRAGARADARAAKAFALAAQPPVVLADGAPAGVATPVMPGMVATAAAPPRTAWEEAWLARTGSLPTTVAQRQRRRGDHGAPAGTGGVGGEPSRS